MVDEKEGDLKELVNQAEVSIILDKYDDLFSSFDPRPYNIRELSEDFLREARRAAREKKEGIELRFLIPKGQRNTNDEATIKQHLKEHFRKRQLHAKSEIKKYKKQAITLIGIGTVIGFVAVWLSLQDIPSVLKHAVEIIFSPASWFTIWTGFEHLTFTPKEYISEEKFSRKMVNAHIGFSEY